jgi:hypothetical protein
VRPPERQEPADYRRAIDEVVARLGDNSTRAPATRAAEAARRLVAQLERCDLELDALSSSSGESMSDRMRAQLALLEGAMHADDETRELTELAELLRAQLDVMQRMRVRCEMLSSQRARMLNLLHGLWTQLAALREVAPRAEGEALARVDAVRAEIEAELDEKAALSV